MVDVVKLISSNRVNMKYDTIGGEACARVTYLIQNIA